MNSARLQDTRLKCKNQFYFCILAPNKPEMKLRKQFPYKAPKGMKYLGINLTEEM